MQIHARTPRAQLVTPVTPDHVNNLMADVRRCDQDEWVGALGFPMKIALDWASREKCAMTSQLKDGRVLGIFGAHAMPREFVDAYGCYEDAGLLWLAATNLGYDHIPDFAVLTISALQYLHTHYPVLTAFVDDRNVTHHDWLVRVGFTFEERIDRFGPFSLPYWKVTRQCAHPSSVSPSA